MSANKFVPAATRPEVDFRSSSGGIAGIPAVQPPRSVSAMVPTPAGAYTVDRRFALIDREGRHRYAQILNGTFQVGKARTALPSDLGSFARAIINDGEGGRFASGDGSKHGILGYGGRAREAVAYELDAAVAKRAGVPTSGRL